MESFESFEGKIISFNGKYGFIKFEKGTAYFHSSYVKPELLPNLEVNSRVVCEVMPSTKKPGTWQVVRFISIEKYEKKEHPPDSVAIVKFFDDNRRFGFLSNENGDYFVHGNDLKNTTSINKDEICLFYPNPSIKKNSSYDARSVYVLRKNIENLESLVDEYLKIIQKLDNATKYEQVKEIYKFLNQSQQSEFIQKAYQIADEDRKIYFWIDGYTNQVNLDYLPKVLEKTIDFYFYFYERIFKKLTEEERFKVSMDFLIHIQKLDNDTKYEQVKKIYEQLSLNNKFYFIRKAYEMFNKESEEVFNLANHQFEDLRLKDSIEEFLFLSSFLLLKPKKNKYYGIPLLKLIQTDILYVKNNVEVFDSSLLKFFYGLLKFEYFRYYPSDEYKEIENFISYKLENFDFKSLLSSGNLSESLKIEIVATIGELSKYLTSPYKSDFFEKYANIFIENLEQNIDKYLKNEEDLINKLMKINIIDKEICNNFINRNAIYFSTYTKMKLWLHDLYEIFDYNNYGFYYFRLNKYEKKRYNQKARELMKEEVKKMMIAQRIPWQYQYTDEKNINHYTATWRSIWFLDKKIKFCIKEIDDENIFSVPYEWEYSKEEFNFLYGYLSKKRIEEVIVQEKEGVILKVKGLDILEEYIYKAIIEKEVKEKGLENFVKKEGENKIPPSLIIRNQCINYLNDLQDAGISPIVIYEISRDYTTGNIYTDTSLLFSITRNEYVFIIWESLEFNKAKATHIFKVEKEIYGEYFENISSFIQNNLKVRSKLNSNDFEEKEKLKYLCRIEHDNFDFKKWENQLLNILEN